jgi:hypothetical protein
MSRDLSDEEYEEAAREALTRPTGVIPFHYYGSLPLWESWGLVYGKSDDADAMRRSNWRVMLADLQGVATADVPGEGAESTGGDGAEDCTDYVDTFHIRGYGGNEVIAVRVLADENGEISVDNLTETFKRATDLVHFLRDSCCLDDSDFSELEWEECEEAFGQAWQSVTWSEVSLTAQEDDELRNRIFEEMTENDTPDSFDEDEIEKAVREHECELAQTEHAERFRLAHAGQFALIGADL